MPKPETVAALVDWLFREANTYGRYYSRDGQAIREWKAKVETRIRAAVAREQQGRLG